MRAALALALCALQAVSSERDEHGMRQALRLARMRAPRERRGPGAGLTSRQTDFYGGANRTRLWPRTKHLQPLLRRHLLARRSMSLQCLQDHRRHWDFSQTHIE